MKLAGLLLLVACTRPSVSVPTAWVPCCDSAGRPLAFQEVPADSLHRAVWDSTVRCLTGRATLRGQSFSATRWYTMAGELVYSPGAVGAWDPPSGRIYLAKGQARAPGLIAHEITHAVVPELGHDPHLFACAAEWTRFPGLVALVTVIADTAHFRREP